MSEREVVPEKGLRRSARWLLELSAMRSRRDVAARLTRNAVGMALCTCFLAACQSSSASQEPPPAAAASTPSSTPPAAASSDVEMAPASLGQVKRRGIVTGLPFTPAVAAVRMVAPDGLADIELNDGNQSCELVTVDRALVISIPWKAGATLDLASKREVTHMDDKGMVPVASMFTTQVVRDDGTDGGKPNLNVNHRRLDSFDPRGTATLVTAPKEKDSVARLELHLKSGEYELDGVVNVKVCFDLTAP
jgi:hypothetical protein